MPFDLIRIWLVFSHFIYDCVNVSMVFRAHGSLFSVPVNQMSACVEVLSLTLHMLICMWVSTVISGLVQRWQLETFKWPLDSGLSFAHSEERGRKDKRWRIVWYSVSLVHPGRCNFRKSKAIYQYPFNLISSYRPLSCEGLRKNMWRAVHDSFMPLILVLYVVLRPFVSEPVSLCFLARWKFQKRIDKRTVNQQSEIISYQLGTVLALFPISKRHCQYTSNVNDSHKEFNNKVLLLQETAWEWYFLFFTMQAAKVLTHGLEKKPSATLQNELTFSALVLIRS